MAQSILIPLIERGDFLPEEVIGVVGNEDSVQRVIDQCPKGLRVVAANNLIAQEVWKAPLQLLAVKPQQLNSIKERFKACKAESSEKALLISLLAGVPVSKLEDIFSGYSCVRVVPNIPVIVKEGLTGLAWGERVTMDQRLNVMKMLKPISEVFELPEKQLDAFLALTSSGPAYVAVITEALADGAVAAGLSRPLANYLAHRTLAGTASLLKEKELHPSQLKDMVASPGGTTITALRHLEMAGVRSALMEAVVVAAERSRELSG